MRRLLLAAALAAAPLAGHAQDSSDEGSSLLEDGASLFFRGLLEEVQPPLEELAGIGAGHLLTLQAIFEEMGPAFAEVFEQIDSISYYDPPEILPNGDIIFRRSPDAPDWTAQEATAEPERAEPNRSVPEPAAPEEEVAPWMRPPPSEPGDDLRVDPTQGMEL